MSDEIPPSNLVTAPPGPRPSSATQAAWMLRLHPDRWRTAPPSGAKGLGVVMLGWFLLAWNRLGFQGFEAPRSVMRFLLVGIYGWLLAAAVIGLALLLLSRTDGRTATDGPPAGTGPAGSRPVTTPRVLYAVGAAHQPLVVVGVLMVVTQLFNVPGLLLLVSGAALLVWMPAMLAVACSTMTGGFGRAAAVVVPVHIVWLLTAGRFLFDRVGHLL